MKFLKNIFFFIYNLYVWFICQKALLGFHSACMSLQDCAFFFFFLKNGQHQQQNRGDVSPEQESTAIFTEFQLWEESPAGLMSTTELDADLKMLNIWKDRNQCNVMRLCQKLACSVEGTERSGFDPGCQWWWWFGPQNLLEVHQS